MASKDVAPLMAKEFVTVRLDYDRGIGAQNIERRFIDEEQGLPWFAFVAPDGTAIVHSTRPDRGNIGHPNSPDEVEYFKTMLLKARKHLTAADIDNLITSLVAFNKAANIK
jgi:hypothetical protein